MHHLRFVCTNGSVPDNSVHVSIAFGIQLRIYSVNAKPCCLHTHTRARARTHAHHSLPQKGYTALMTAAEYSRNEMCELLLRNGATMDCAAAVSHIVGVPLLCGPLKGDWRCTHLSRVGWPDSRAPGSNA